MCRLGTRAAGQLKATGRPPRIERHLSGGCCILGKSVKKASQVSENGHGVGSVWDTRLRLYRRQKRKPLRTTRTDSDPETHGISRTQRILHAQRAFLNNLKTSLMLAEL